MPAVTPAAAAAPRSAIRRWLPVIVLAAAMGLSFAMGWHRYLSFKTIGLNYEALRGLIDANLPLALLGFIAAYVAVVALSLPGALIMTLSGGLLFGWKLGAPATIVGATLGASIIFLIARGVIGPGASPRSQDPSRRDSALVRVLSGGMRRETLDAMLARLRDGFRENALSYLLFLRLVPAFPFVIVNLAAAALGVPLRSYLIGTFFGIMPASTAYSFAGSALGSTIANQNAAYRACLTGRPEGSCTYSIDTSALVSRELILAFALLGVVALIPVVIKKWRARHAAV